MLAENFKHPAAKGNTHATARNRTQLVSHVAIQASINAGSACTAYSNAAVCSWSSWACSSGLRVMSGVRTCSAGSTQPRIAASRFVEQRQSASPEAARILGMYRETHNLMSNQGYKDTVSAPSETRKHILTRLDHRQWRALSEGYADNASQSPRPRN